VRRIKGLDTADPRALEATQKYHPLSLALENELMVNEPVTREVTEAEPLVKSQDVMTSVPEVVQVSVTVEPSETVLGPITAAVGAGGGEGRGWGKGRKVGSY